ncbi:MAG: hemolysin III family protein [Actinomycetota bacterium]|nr:hemolysin III family protein [Actinomycetota bacterium]
MTRTTGAVVVKPLLRGWLHAVCFVLSIPAGAVVVASASTTRARVGAVIYAIGLAAVFGVSAAYHRGRWSDAARRRMKRLDHGTIFVMIAGSYTPLCLVRGGAEGVGLLVAAWGGAAVGLGLAAFGIAEKPVVGMACYIGLAWLLAIALPELTGRMSPTEYRLLVAGGIAYTAGAILFGTHRPNPIPGIFGYHEVWHLLVVVAAVLHYGTIISVVRTGA